MMRIYKIILAIILIVITMGDLFSQIIDPQSYEKNSTKYWLYRERLKEYFITNIGPESGESMPASKRRDDYKMEWGDATIHLSEYIMVLATEIKLLDLSGNDYYETSRELFYAMWAFNRLDFEAEVAFGQTANLNGFFIRDDIMTLNPDQTLKNKLNLNIPDSRMEVKHFTSDYTSPEQYDKEPSIDQIYWTLMAMKAVKECVPPGLFFIEIDAATNQPIVKQFQDLNIFFVTEAENISRRIIKAMRTVDPTGWEWYLMNPTTFPPQFSSYHRGAYDGTTLAYPMIKIHKNITGENLPMRSYHLLSPSQRAKFHVSRGIWDYLSLHADPTPAKEDFKAIQLAAVANDWYNGSVTQNSAQIAKRSTWIQHQWVNLYHASMWHSGYDYFPNNVYNPQCDRQNIDPTLHNPSYWPHFVQVRNLLSTSNCNGFWNYDDIWPDYDWGHYNWSSHSLTVHPEQRGIISGCEGYNWPGAWNGLDYMLIHNLWYYYWSQFVPSFLPPFTNKSSTAYYTNYIPMWTLNPPFNYGYMTSYPFQYLSLNKIKSDAIVMNAGPALTANIQFRASTEIELLPGFETMAGVQFEAYIDDIECDDLTGELFRIMPASEAPAATINDVYKNFHLGNSIFVSPNPSNSEITILTPVGTEANIMEIIGFNGIVVKKLMIDNPKEINEIKVNIEDLSSGVYFIRVGTNYKKVIKL